MTTGAGVDPSVAARAAVDRSGTAPAPEWSLPAVLDVVAAAVPECEMLVHGTVRRTFAEVQERSRHLAAFLHRQGLGVRRERSELERWECGQSPVAVLLFNCPEYIETMFGAYRARAVPFNVNHHYNPREVAALLDQVGAEAVVYHRRLAPLLGDGAVGDRLLVEVDDASEVESLPGSTTFESAIAEGGDGADLPEPSPDDLYLVCTGGTTGAPKGVLWRQADAYVSAMGGTEETTAASIRDRIVDDPGVWFAACPLMHAAAQWTAFSGFLSGKTVVVHDDAAPFSARTILETAASERVTLMSIVGDAYARPLIEELRSGRYDLSSLRRLGTGGAMTSAASKHALLELLPHVTVVDGYGASETGGMAFGASVRAREAAGLRLSPGGAVLSADRSHLLEPGDTELGWTARVGRIPLGYLGDPAKTERTFPVIGGRRVSVPGDRARYAADGSIVMLGRDAMVVNTGGEKVFVEEVEEAICQHPDVVDALVVGRPSERFGEEVVALVQRRPGARLTPGEVREFATRSVARFKAPRAVLFCERIGRHPSGKPDYAWARREAPAAQPVAD